MVSGQLKNTLHKPNLSSKFKLYILNFYIDFEKWRNCGLILREIMRKEIIIILSSVFVFLISCQTYPSYEQIKESRSKIKAETFTKEKWFDDKDIGVEIFWEERPKLARDLMNRKLLIGKSFNQVTELLGKEQKDEKSNSINYNIRIENGVVDPIYIEKFIIYFDKENKVNNTEIKIVMMDGHPDYR